MFLSFLRTVVGEVPTYVQGTSYNQTQYYGDLLEYSIACILCFVAVVLTFRLFFYIVNIFRGKGARKL